MKNYFITQASDYTQEGKTLMHITAVSMTSVSDNIIQKVLLNAKKRIEKGNDLVLEYVGNHVKDMGHVHPQGGTLKTYTLSFEVKK